jgi:hypothetical protein
LRAIKSSANQTEAKKTRSCLSYRVAIARKLFSRRNSRSTSFRRLYSSLSYSHRYFIFRFGGTTSLNRSSHAVYRVFRVPSRQPECYRPFVTGRHQVYLRCQLATAPPYRLNAPFFSAPRPSGCAFTIVESQTGRVNRHGCQCRAPEHTIDTFHDAFFRPPVGPYLDDMPIAVFLG